MPVHRHDRFYQIHWLEHGEVTLQLGDSHYQGQGPLFFFTPPAVPHSFVLDDSATGSVVTVSRDLLGRMTSGGADAVLEQKFSAPVFCELRAVAGHHAAEAERLQTLMRLLNDEFFADLPGRKHSLPALVSLALISIFRLAELPERDEPLRLVELKIFDSFNALIDKNYTQNLSMPDYARDLNVTTNRLADICRRLSGRSPKSLVYERQIKEAKWQLIYTTSAINAISDALGFKDPAYFCRFFTKHSGLSPREFRKQKLMGTLDKNV